MAASRTFYNDFAKKVGNGTIDLAAHTLKVMLCSSSYTPSAAHSVKADITNELATANGYTAGGKALENVDWDQAAGVATLAADDTSWTASGGSITARYAVVYDDTAASKDLLFYVLLNATPADVTATNGNMLTLQWDATGVLNITPA